MMDFIDQLYGPQLIELEDEEGNVTIALFDPIGYVFENGVVRHALQRDSGERFSVLPG